MPGPFGKMEGLLERAFELPMRRFFRVALQPVELTRAAARAMEASAQVTARGLQVANHYVLGLHPNDFQAFASWRETMERELGDYLQQYAVQRGWHCVGRPRVELQADPAAPLARPRVSATADETPAPPPPTLIGRLPDATSVMLPAAEPPPPVPTAAAALAWLEREGCPLWPMEKASVQIGRAPGNDLVLDDAGVSRYHARIDIVGGTFVLFDLASSNGTWYQGRAVTEQPLGEGDSFSLGRLPIRFWPAH